MINTSYKGFYISLTCIFLFHLFLSFTVTLQLFVCSISPPTSAFISPLFILSDFISSSVPPPPCPPPFFFASPRLPFPLQCCHAAASYLSVLSSSYIHFSWWVATELARLHILALRASRTTSLFHCRTEQLQSNG